MSKKYKLSDTQIRHLSILCFRESGNIIAGVKAVASQMCNYYEKWQTKNFSSLYECVFGSGWYWSKAKNEQWVKEHPNVPQAVVDAVKDVIVNGNRTLPEYVDEYDCLEDIGTIINDGVAHTEKSYIQNRANYHKDKTIIRNIYAEGPGDKYTFFCFPDGADGHCDAFGYINKTVTQNAETGASESIPDNACAWAEGIAADQSHGYSQADRWGPNFDCSSLVIYAYIMAGVPIDKNKVYYTGNMQGLKNYGFVDVTEQCDLDTGEGMLRGDILYYHISGTNGHTAMYCGGGKIVHARGQSYGSPASGDQGTEIAVTNYSRSKWQYVLRYKGSASGSVNLTETLMSSIALTTVKLTEIRQGSTGPLVSTLQAILDLYGYKGKDLLPIEIDGEYGANTAYAVMAFQKAAGITSDGICGAATWKRLLSGLVP